MEAPAEFISQTSSDMNNFSAVKEDKTAALHETVSPVKALVGQGLCFIYSHSPSTVLLLLLLGFCLTGPYFMVTTH